MFWRLAILEVKQSSNGVSHWCISEEAGEAGKAGNPMRDAEGAGLPLCPGEAWAGTTLSQRLRCDWCRGRRQVCVVAGGVRAEMPRLLQFQLEWSNIQHCPWGKKWEEWKKISGRGRGCSWQVHMGPTNCRPRRSVVTIRPSWVEGGCFQQFSWTEISPRSGEGATALYVSSWNNHEASQCDWVYLKLSTLRFLFFLIFIFLIFKIFLLKYSWFLKNFYWSIVDLQCCISFWCTVKWFSYTYI